MPESETPPPELFIQERTTLLESDEVTPEQINQVFFEMQQYAPLRYVLEQKNDEIAQKIANGESIKETLLAILKLQAPAAIKQPEADQPKSPGEIAMRAQSFQEAQKLSDEAIARHKPNLKQASNTYAARYTDWWVAELRRMRMEGRLGEFNEAEVREKITNAARAVPLVTSREELVQKMLRADPTLALYQEAFNAEAPDINTPQELVEAENIRKNTTKIILDHPEVTKYDTLVNLMAQGVAPNKAASLTLAAEGYSATINSATDATASSKFFQAVAKTKFQKAVAPAIDTVLMVFPQETREAIIESVLAKSWERTRDRIQETIQLKKEQFTDAELHLLTEAIKQGNQAFGDKRPIGGFGGIVGDVIGTVTRTGIDPEMQEFIVELGKRGMLEPGQTITPEGITTHSTWHNFHLAFSYAHQPSLFHFSFDAGRSILNWIGVGGKKITAGALEKGASVITTKLAGKGLGATIGGFFTGPLAPVGAFIGSIIGDKIIGGFLNGAKFLLGGFINRLFGAGEDGGLLGDSALLMALIPVAAIAVLFVLPTFLNFNFLNVMSTTSALVDMGKGGGDRYFDPDFIHPGGPLLPENIASGTCPLDGGTINVGSFNRKTDTGHGSSSYWGGRTPSYAIPIGAMTPGCSNPSCPYYGFAIDVTGSGPVRVPRVCPKDSASCGDLTWTVTGGWYNCSGKSVSSPAECPSGSGWGYGYILTADGNGHSWQIYLNHITRVGGGSFNSGTNNVIGALSSDLGSGAHVHIELNMDGIPLRPDFLCGG